MGGRDDPNLGQEPGHGARGLALLAARGRRGFDRRGRGVRRDPDGCGRHGLAATRVRAAFGAFAAGAAARAALGLRGAAGSTATAGWGAPASASGAASQSSGSFVRRGAAAGAGAVVLGRRVMSWFPFVWRGARPA